MKIIQKIAAFVVCVVLGLYLVVHTTGKYESKKKIKNTNFEPRNTLELHRRMTGIQNLMKPFVNKLSRIGQEMRTEALNWLNVTSSVVANGYEMNYFQKVTHAQIKNNNCQI